MTAYNVIVVLGTGSGTCTPSIGTHTGQSGSVTFIAVPTTGYGFQNFVYYSDANPTPIVTNTNSTSLTINANFTVIVNFVAISSSSVYCVQADVQDRLLIDSSMLTEYSDSLNASMAEASRLVDIFLKPYTSVPLTTPDDEVEMITADFSASIFKRRYVPQEVSLQGRLQPDQLGAVEASGWFAQGMRKMEMYIKSYFTLAQAFQSTNILNNSEVFTKLFKDGVITGMEARAMMAAASQELTNRQDTLAKIFTETITRTETVTKTVIDTENQYHTKTQKSFVFVGSDGDNQPDGGYKEE